MKKVRSNKLWYLINRQQIEIFARSRGQKIILLPVRNIDVDKLELQDNLDVKVRVYWILMYTKDVPAAILSNISGDCQWSAG